MAYFAYKARNSGGELVQGVLESPDSGAAASQLFNLGITPVEIEPTSAPAASGEVFFERLFKEPISQLDLMLFSRQMYTLLKAGVPIMRALAGLQESTTNKTFSAVIKDIRESLESGRELSPSLARQPGVFSPFYVNMVRVGEMTGQLEEIFLRMFHHLEFEKFMREQVKSAIRYPSFVVATMAIALVIINLFVIPAFAKVYKNFNAELPLMTRILIEFSNFMVAWWPAMLVGLIAVIFGFRWWVNTPAGKLRWDEIKLKFPIAGKIIVKATLSRFARSFALASRSGVPVVQALTTVAQTVDNDFIARKIEKMREGVERGESVLRTAVASGVFTPVVLQMVAVGEESGAVDDMMQEVADLYQREVEYELKTLSSQIEPVLIIALGVMVLILALGVFLPMWDLGKNMIK
ncbi:MAG: type II secretion system F family protein [Betaproteobacteria bacterium]|nr:type II secretion system F family protein [Betaproteobacteria bacterium]